MADLFSKAEAYDNFMGRSSARLACPFIEFARIRDGENVFRCERKLKARERTADLRLRADPLGGGSSNKWHTLATKIGNYVL